jgi:hypothetical protein
MLDTDYNDYKQIAFKLQDDIEMLKWEQAQKDLPFLREMRERLNKYYKNQDITQLDMVNKMIEDWITELEKIEQ